MSPNNTQAGQSSTTLKFYTTAQLVPLLQMSTATINRRLKDGTIPHVKIGHAVRIPAVYVDGLLAQANGQAVQS
jgi:excisionase family DNA binding protein